MTEQERAKLLKAATAFYRVSYCRAEHERTLRDLQDEVASVNNELRRLDREYALAIGSLFGVVMKLCNGGERLSAQDVLKIAFDDLLNHK